MPMQDACPYDVVSAAFHSAPNPTLAAMRDREGLYWHPELRCWIATRYEDVQLVMRDDAFSVDKGGDIHNFTRGVPRPKLEQCNDLFSTWMVFADPPQHTKLRAALAKILSPQVVVNLRPLVEKLADELLDRVQSRGRMDFMRDFALPLPALMVEHLLGIPREKTADLKRWSQDIFEFLGSGRADGPVLEAMHASLLECREYFQALVDQRRRKPGHDLVSQLLGLDLDHEQVLASAQMIMVGSNETTAYLLTNSLVALLNHPDQMARLREEPELIERAVEELIRYTGPALSIIRRALRDVSVGGADVRKGDMVCCMLHAANFDPAHFTNPEDLDIARQGNRHLGLGYGIHFCVGAALARMETRIGLSTLLRRFRDFRLSDAHVAWHPNLVLRGTRSLDLRFRSCDAENETLVSSSQQEGG